MSVVFVQLKKQVSSWRVVWPAQALKARGHDAHALAFGAAGEGALEPGDTVVLHVTSELGVDLLNIVRRLKQHTGRLVLTVDDNWLAIANIQVMNPHAAEFRMQFIEALKLADLLVCATPELHRALSPFTMAACVVPNFLPARFTRIRKPGPGLRDRLAWMGQMGVHRRDWEWLRPLVPDLPPLLLVGASESGAELLRSWGHPDVIATEATDDVAALYLTMAGARAAIVPLVDDEFNRAKSWNKPMEFAACGVASAAPPHPAYREAASYGVPVHTTGAYDPGDLAVMAAVLYDADETVELPPWMCAEGAGADAWELVLNLPHHDMRAQLVR